MRHRNWLTTLVLVSVLAVVAAACSNNNSSTPSAGGSGGGGGPDCNTPPGCVTVAAGAPIEIGTLLATTGSTKSLGLDSLYGVELVNESDGCSADGGQQGATTLAADPQIVGVIGTSCSSASLGVADKIFSDKGITIISPSATNPPPTGESPP